MKDKLITLLKSNKEDAVQAIELNKTLGLLQAKEAAPILMENLMQGGWVVSEMIQKIEELDNDWHTFLQKRGGASWTFDYETENTILSEFPAINLFGEVGLDIDSNTSLEEHGKNIGKFLILAEKQILSWLSKQPLVKRPFPNTILNHPSADHEGIGWSFYIAIEIDFDFFTQHILEN